MTSSPVIGSSPVLMSPRTPSVAPPCVLDPKPLLMATGTARPEANPVGAVAASGFVIAVLLESSFVVVSVVEVLSVEVLSVDAEFVDVLESLFVVPVFVFSSPVDACGGPAFATGAAVFGSIAVECPLPSDCQIYPSAPGWYWVASMPSSSPSTVICGPLVAAGTPSLCVPTPPGRLRPVVLPASVPLLSVTPRSGSDGVPPCRFARPASIGDGLLPASAGAGCVAGAPPASGWSAAGVLCEPPVSGVGKSLRLLP